MKQLNKAHIQLIEDLLNCPNQEAEREILKARSNLVDRDLVQTMEAVAVEMEQEGDKNKAARLRRLARLVARVLANQQRLPEYLQLIETLDNSPAEEISEILIAHQELIDDGLVLAMKALAVFKINEGNQDAADWLRFMANQLKDVINIKFLYEVLSASYNNSTNPSKVYPLLEDNLDKLNDKFAELLRTWAEDAFSSEPEKAQEKALDIAEFSTIISSFPLGDISNNQEIAITGFEIALTIVTYDSLLTEWWAIIQNNIGNVYTNRLQGNRSDNLEKAINYFEAALQVHTRQEYPDKWAGIQNNLGIAYCNCPQGNRADNLEKAINYFKAALQVHTFDAFPDKWAAIQRNLGAAYSEHIKGVQANNLELSIRCYEEALQVHTREKYPEEWAAIQNNLGNVYRYRIKEKRADNLELAIHHCKLALQVRTPEKYPEKCAMTLNNLGIAYLYRIERKREDNLEFAISCLEATLDLYTYEKFPEQWAQTQVNLGNAYAERVKGIEADNLELAIGCYQTALQVYTEKDFPEKWAGTQMNLGSTYALQKEIAEAFKYYQSALKILTPKDFPSRCLQTARNLAYAASSVADWATAIKGFDYAIQAVEQSRSWAFSHTTKQEIMAEAMDVYANIVFACVETEQIEKAVEYVERSKTRNLVELLANRDVYPKADVPPEIITELDRLRRELLVIQQQDDASEKTENITTGRSPDGDNQGRSQLFATVSTDSNPVQNYINSLQQQLAQLVNQIKPYDPEFSLTQEVKHIKFSDIQALLDDRTAIIEWYVTKLYCWAFIITRHQPPQFWRSEPKDRIALEEWANNYRHRYTKQKAQWLSDLNNQLAELSRILHIDEIVDLIPPQITQLILTPHRWLHLFPLHALPVSDAVVRSRRLLPKNIELDDRPPDGYRLLDCFPNGVSYAPSCQLLQLAQKRDRPEFSHLFAIANPTKDRYLLELQSANIHHRFKSNDFLAKDDANKKAIQNQQLSFANCAHFGCHGKFEPDSPLESALILANKERLTLLEILALNLDRCRLVTLSACETGLTQSTTTDEYIGLPFGFLLAGSPSMVSSLWEVDQLASTLLLIRFYENLETLSTVIALNEAQQWLRNLTSDELEAVLEDLKPQIDRIFDQLPKKEHRRFVKAPQEGARNRKPFPFAEPLYWAGFTAIGV